MHLTEGRNTGFRKILNALEKNGSPKPIFYTDEERLSFTTTLFIHPEFKNDTVNEGVNEGVNHLSSRLSAKEKEVYEIIKKDPSLSMSNMKTVLGVSESTIYRAIKQLKAQEYIRREGSDKKGKWMILKEI